MSDVPTRFGGEDAERPDPIERAACAVERAALRWERAARDVEKTLERINRASTNAARR